MRYNTFGRSSGLRFESLWAGPKLPVFGWAWSAGALLAITGLIAVTMPVAAKPLSEVVRLALSTHPEVKRDQALQQASERFIDEQFAGYLPRLDVEAGSGFEYTNSPSTRGRNGIGRNDPESRGLWRNDGSVTLAQMLFDGFETRSRVRSARSDRDAANGAVVQISEQVAIEAVAVYLEVLRNQELVTLAEENVAAHQDILERVRQQVEAGIADSVDLEQGKARMALARSGLSRSIGDLRAASSRYTEIVGEAPKQLVRPVDPPTDEPIDVDGAIANAMEDNPILAVTGARAKARAADIDVGRAPYFPRFDIEFAGTSIDNLDGVLGPNTDFSVLLRMRHNLFRGFFDQASKRRAAFNAAAAADDDSEARRAIREDVRSTYRALLTAQARLVPLRDRVDAAVRTFQAYVGQFELGRRSLFDLLDAQNELFRAHSELVAEEYAVMVGRYRLLFTMGRLLPSLSIEAPVS